MNKIFPCDPIDKHPLVKWKDVASSDPEIINSWWEKFPDALVGRMELEDEITVDVDVKGNVEGDQSLLQLFKDHPELAAAFAKTHMVKTRSGGWHFKFKNPNGYDFSGTVGVWPGIDIRMGGKNFLIIPPSEGYEVLNDVPRIEIPELFYKLYREQRSSKYQESIEYDDNRKYVDGERTDFLVTSAARLRKSGMNDEQTLYALIGINAASCEPPVATEKLENIVKGIRPVKDVTLSDDEEFAQAKANAKLLTSGLEAPPIIARKDPKAPLITCLTDFEPKEYKFAWFPYLALGTLTGLSADGGTGKGTLASFLIALATTGRWSELGKTDVKEPMNVVVFTKEDDPGAKIQPEVELAGGNMNRVFICNKLHDGTSFTFASPEKFDEAFATVFADGKPGLAIIDNASDFGDKANDGNGFKAVTQELTPITELAAKYNATVLLMMHENRSGGFMGSASYKNKLRSMLSLKRTDERNVNIMKHEKSNLFCGNPVLFGADEHAVTGRKYNVWKVHYKGEATEEQAEKSIQQRINDYVRERIAAMPIPNNMLIEEIEAMNGSKYHLTRARKAVGAGMVTIDGIKCTADAFYITSKQLFVENDTEN